MKIAVIGGGVIGVSCATHLAQAGAAVTLFTDTDWASGASGRSLSWLNASAPGRTLIISCVWRVLPVINNCIISKARLTG